MSHPRRAERGASSAEYVGAIVVAAILTGSVIFAVSPQGSGVRSAACEAVGSIVQQDLGCASGEGGDEAGAPPTDEDFTPAPCEVSSTGSEYNTVISLGIVDIGENAALVRTVMSDGTVTLTATDGGMLGLSGGVGADAEAGGGAQLGASIDFGGGVTFNTGDTWTFPDQESADSFEDLLSDHQVRQMTYEQNGLSGAVLDFIDPLDPLPLPTSVTSEIGVTGEVQGQLGLDLAGNEDGSGPSLELQAVAGSVQADAVWVQTTNTNNTESGDDDTTTFTVDMKVNPDVSSDIWAVDLGLGDTIGMSLAITQDAEGRITEVTIVSTSEGAINGGASIEGGGKSGKNEGSGSLFTSETATTATVTTTTLTLDPQAPGYAQDLAVVEGWLGPDAGGYEWEGAIPMGAVNPAHPGDDPFSQLMHEQATVSAITSEGVTNSAGLAAQISLGLKLGFDFSISESQAEAVYAAYLGAPDNGVRTMVPYDDCVS